MIATLRGRIIDRSMNGTVIVETAGVGYEVTMHTRASERLGTSDEILLYVHHHIREDAQSLYAFASQLERNTFRILIATHGVGPALAMAILQTHEPASLVDLVGRGDITALTLVPGVGRKTAERLIVELRSRLELPALEDPSADGDGSVLTEVRGALTQLGYDPSEIVSATSAIPEGADTASALRHALGVLGGRHA